MLAHVCGFQLITLSQRPSNQLSRIAHEYELVPSTLKLYELHLTYPLSYTSSLHVPNLHYFTLTEIPDQC